MSEGDALQADLEALVARQFPGNQLVSHQRLTGGVSADVFRLDIQHPEAGASSIVLRMHGATHDGHSAALEHQLLSALHDAGVKVPAPLGFDAAGSDLSDPYLIIEYIEGSSEIPADRRNDAIERMAAELAGIHSQSFDALPVLPVRVDPRPEVFDFLPAGEEWLPLTRTLRALENASWPGEQVLLHGDFWPENLLWRDGDIVAVLDWEDAAIGDPMADLAGACVELRYLFGAEAMTIFTDAYSRYRPVDEIRQALWQVYVAAAAQKYMGGWGLPAAREAHMRGEALASIRDAAVVLESTIKS